MNELTYNHTRERELDNKWSCFREFNEHASKIEWAGFRERISRIHVIKRAGFTSLVSFLDFTVTVITWSRVESMECLFDYSDRCMWTEQVSKFFITSAKSHVRSRLVAGSHVYNAYIKFDTCRYPWRELMHPCMIRVYRELLLRRQWNQQSICSQSRLATSFSNFQVFLNPWRNKLVLYLDEIVHVCNAASITRRTRVTLYQAGKKSQWRSENFPNILSFLCLAANQQCVFLHFCSGGWRGAWFSITNKAETAAASPNFFIAIFSTRPQATLSKGLTEYNNFHWSYISFTLNIHLSIFRVLE